MRKTPENFLIYLYIFCASMAVLPFLPLFANTNNHMLLDRELRLFRTRQVNHPALTDYNISSSYTGIIKNDFLLNDDTIGGARQQNPAIAINNQVNVVIAWTDFRDGNADIYVQRMDTNHNLIGNNFRVNTDATMMWQGEPSIAVHNNGSFVVSWEDRRTWNSDVYLQRFDASGQPLNDNIVVNDNSGSSDQRNCDVVILPNQEIVVVWDDWRNDWGDIYLQRFDSMGNRLGTNQRVNNDQIGNTQYHPSIGYDHHNNFVITWMDGRHGDWDIYAQRFNHQAQPIGTNFLVNDYHNSFQNYPEIAVQPDANFIIVWEDQRYGNTDIFCQRFDSSGNRLGLNFKVNDDATAINQSSPNITLHQSGNFLVVWTDSRQMNPDIFAQFYDQSGTPTGSNFRINDDMTNKNQGAPAVANISSGKFWMVWDDDRNNHDDIYFQVLNSDLTFINNNQKVNDDLASAHQRCSWITQDENGNYVVTWEDERDGNCDIYAVRLDSLGNIVGDNFKVNDDFTNAHYYPSVASNFFGDFVIVWSDNRNNNFDIYAQKYSGTGMPISINFRVNDDTTSSSQWYPIVTCDSIGNFVIVWSDYRNNNYDVYAQRYDHQANPVGTNFMVHDNLNSDQSYATVNANRTGNFVVSWMDNRSNNYDVYAQIFSQSGQPIGNNFQVNDNLDNSFQGYPNLCLHDNDQFVIVWEDERRYNTDIFMQRYSANGTALDTNIRINTDIYDEAQYSPSVAYDHDGNYVVVWCYLRGVDEDIEIFSQAYNSIGQAIGNNLQVHQPDLFSGNNQWLIGQGVAVNNNRIGFAWIDNRRHQGWDIYAKIVNWNFFSGVAEQSSLNNKNPVKIYPNPCCGKIFLHSSLPIRDCKIYNSLGQIVNTTRNGQVINLSGLESGIYFIKYNIENNNYIDKIILSSRSKNVKQ
jgi:hypothetical protein